METLDKRNSILKVVKFTLAQSSNSLTLLNSLTFDKEKKNIIISAQLHVEKAIEKLEALEF